ncbi:hypothetical protein BOG92_020990 [Streptomyces sp. WAC00263]|nr:hypothetical protein BOG92_020990 [Streptomyces sp. WAC00263]
MVDVLTDQVVLDHTSLTTAAALGGALRRRMFEDFGFESERAAPALVRMRNCPFRPMTAKTPELVCSVNQAFLAGCLEGHGLKHLGGGSHPRGGEAHPAAARRRRRLPGAGPSIHGQLESP